MGLCAHASLQILHCECLLYVVKKFSTSNSSSTGPFTKQIIITNFFWKGKPFNVSSLSQWLLLPITPHEYPRIFPRILDTQSKIGYCVHTPCKTSWDILYPVPSNLCSPCKIPMGIRANTKPQLHL